MPRIRDFAYNRTAAKEQQQSQPLKVTMFEEEVKADNEPVENPQSDVKITVSDEDTEISDISEKSEDTPLQSTAPAFKVDVPKPAAISLVKNSGTENSGTEEDSKDSKVMIHNAVEAVNIGGNMVEKVIKAEKELLSKYTDVAAAIKSIVVDGDYYEDYTKGAANKLTESKDFVLAVIAQNADRFFSPLTPTPSDWHDEEFVTAILKILFDRVKEDEDNAAVETAAATLYEFLNRSAFDKDAYAKITTAARLVAKIASASIKNCEDGERTKTAVTRFFASIRTVKDNVIKRFEKDTAADKERAEKLNNVKKGLFGFVEEMVV